MSYWWCDNSSRHHHRYFHPLCPHILESILTEGCSPHCGQKDVGQIDLRIFVDLFVIVCNLCWLYAFFVGEGVGGGLIGSNQYYYGE